MTITSIPLLHLLIALLPAIQYNPLYLLKLY